MADPTIISKGMRYRKLTINPLEALPCTDYCRFCQDETDVEVDEGKWKSLFVYRKRCLRCGQRIQWGVAMAALTSPDPQTLEEVAEWVRETGKDRR